MMFKRVNIGGKIYLKYTCETFETAKHVTSKGGFITGQYNTGWVCYVPLKA